MGGINHQPCGSYLVLSTEISSKFSLMQISFWQSNVALENAILVNLHGGSISLTPALNQINQAINYLVELRTIIVALKTRLELLDFQELPETQEVLDKMGIILKQERGVDFPEDVISNITQILLTSGFYGLFSYYKKRLQEIQVNLELVKQDFNILVTSNHLVKDCEENSTDIRINFSRSMLLINKLLTEWAFSSLVSAMAWNLNQGHRTLVSLKNRSYTKIAK